MKADRQQGMPQHQQVATQAKIAYRDAREGMLMIDHGVGVNCQGVECRMIVSASIGRYKEQATRDPGSFYVFRLQPDI